MALLANCHRDPAKRSEPFTDRYFAPFLPPPPPPPPPPKHSIEILQLLL